jgi:hypothetical protein
VGCACTSPRRREGGGDVEGGRVALEKGGGRVRTISDSSAHIRQSRKEEYRTIGIGDESTAKDRGERETLC